MAGSTQNVIAAHLEGDWQAAVGFKETFRSDGAPTNLGVRFTPDASVAGSVPDKDGVFFPDLKAPIFLAGHITIKRGEETMRASFVLSVLFGNPHLVFWLDRDGDRFGTLESFIVMLAARDERARVRLFIGGDHATEPFLAFEQVPAAEE